MCDRCNQPPCDTGPLAPWHMYKQEIVFSHWEFYFLVFAFTHPTLGISFTHFMCIEPIIHSWVHKGFTVITMRSAIAYFYSWLCNSVCNILHLPLTFCSLFGLYICSPLTIHSASCVHCALLLLLWYSLQMLYIHPAYTHRSLSIWYCFFPFHENKPVLSHLWTLISYYSQLLIFTC